MKTLIIIPAYNEAEHIAQVVGEIKAAAPQADCLVVNDCSRDATQQVCMERGLSFVSLPLNPVSYTHLFWDGGPRSPWTPPSFCRARRGLSLIHI